MAYGQMLALAFIALALQIHGACALLDSSSHAAGNGFESCSVADLVEPEQGAALLQLKKPDGHSWLQVHKSMPLTEAVDTAALTNGSNESHPRNASIAAGFSNSFREEGATNDMHELPESVENSTSIDIPLTEKENHLAKSVMAISHSSTSRGIDEVVEATDGAREVELETNLGMNVSIEKLEHLETMLEGQSAEAALANSELITASDVADEGNGTRGEDVAVGPPNTTVFQGDMIPQDSAQMSLFQDIASGRHRWVAAGEPWSQGKVKYCFASDTSHKAREIFMAAARQYKSAVPCLTFQNVGWQTGTSGDPASVQRCKQSPAIFVISRKDAGCYSYVGMIPQFQSQQLQLNDPACLSLGTAIHELGHALGMAHEQSRPDRDRYVRVDYTNIDPVHKHDFKIEDGAFTGHPYDYLSVMHYDAYAFAVDHSRPTIIRADGSHEQMGNRVGLSKTDVEQVAAMYAEVKADCAGHAHAGMGCLDRVNSHGLNVCHQMKRCNAKALDLCCGCGGGVKIQCYKGSYCPQPPKLPEPEGSDCMQDKTNLVADWKAKHGCVFTNACSFAVKWKCPSTLCSHVTQPGGLWTMSCNGQAEVEICKKGACSVVQA